MKGLIDALLRAINKHERELENMTRAYQHMLATENEVRALSKKKADGQRSEPQGERSGKGN